MIIDDNGVNYNIEEVSDSIRTLMKANDANKIQFKVTYDRYKEVLADAEEKMKNMNKTYKMIILCGKAGSGKDTLLHEVYEKNKDKLNLIVSDTTRPPRDNEVNGVDYNFVTDSFFQSHLEDYIEYTNFNGWWYGTPTTSFNLDKINIGIMNLQGVESLYDRQDNIKLKLFYISAPDKERMLRQLQRETYPDVEEICRRFLADEEDFSTKSLHKYPFKRIRNASYFSIPESVATIEEAISELSDDSDKIN